jgi:uncharacterized protein
LNYLCAGYKAFFTHVDKPMRIMARLLRRNRAPAEMMLVLAAEDAQLQKTFTKAGARSHIPVAVAASSSRVTGDKIRSEVSYPFLRFGERALSERTAWLCC